MRVCGEIGTTGVMDKKYRGFCAVTHLVVVAAAVERERELGQTDEGGEQADEAVDGACWWWSCGSDYVAVVLWYGQGMRAHQTT